MNFELQLVPGDHFSCLSDAVYASIVHAIDCGKITPGAILSEVAVAKQLDVSRTPVHDAFRQLAKDGLIEQSTRQRARVVELSRDDIFEMFELRKLLEAEAAALAAGRMDARQLAPLQEACHKLAAELRDGQVTETWYYHWRRHDEEFHRTIAECAGNRHLAADICRYIRLRCATAHLPLETDYFRSVVKAHQEILSALQERDDVGAREAMAHHIKCCQAAFIKQLNAREKK